MVYLLLALTGIWYFRTNFRINRAGDPKAYPMALPLHQQISCNFSFSGIVSVLSSKIKALKAANNLDDQTKASM
jgi:tRNA A37 threonylcarbamoyltransferase TsaD